jgi:hypothetical protein
MLGLVGVRTEEYRTGEAPFPSVRVNEDTIIDLTALSEAPGVDEMTKAGGSSGHQANHVCLSVARREFDQIDATLQANGVDTSARRHITYGARANAPEAFYLKDPDGNVIEIRRYYDQADARTDQGRPAQRSPIRPTQTAAVAPPWSRSRSARPAIPVTFGRSETAGLLGHGVESMAWGGETVQETVLTCPHPVQRR